LYVALVSTNRDTETMADRTKTSLVAASLLGGLLLTGCAEQEEALIFLHAPAWPDAEDGGFKSCSVDPASDTYLPRGLLDISFYSAYDMPGIIFNNLLPTAASDNSSGIPNAEVQMIDADVRLAMPQAEDVIDGVEAQDEALVKFSVNMASNSIEAGERHGILVEVVTPETTEALEGQVLGAYGSGVKIELLANVVINAKRAGGSGGKLGLIQTREFTFPIDLCHGCLRSCLACPGGVCPPEGVTDWFGGVCRNAQDALLIPYQCAELDQ
jgi:hypothetical protein